jgi:Domain of unknown function (DUF4190)
MSNTAQGPGWWLASDGRWYPPELWTGPPAHGSAGTTAQPAQPTYPIQPTYPVRGPAADPTYGGTVPPGYAGYGGGNPYAPYGQVEQKKTNGLAIAALICGCAGFLLFVPGILGIIFGFIARGQIKRSDGQQKGDGMAIAGIIVGFGWVALLVLAIALGAAYSNNGNSGVVNSAILLGKLGLGHLSP